MRQVKVDVAKRKMHERPAIKSEKLLLHRDFVEKRRLQLEQIALLCKLYHKKVKISFKTSSGEQYVETSLWMSTGQYIILNDGRFIPVNAIVDIAF